MMLQLAYDFCKFLSRGGFPWAMYFSGLGGRLAMGLEAVAVRWYEGREQWAGTKTVYLRDHVRAV
jgi:hypothetical protein